MKAIFELAGFQYVAMPGSKLRVPHLKDTERNFSDKVLALIYDDENIQEGHPYLPNCKVFYSIIEEKVKGEKIISFKKKRRKGYKVKKGFRPLYSIIKIEKIVVDDKEYIESSVKNVKVNSN